MAVVIDKSKGERLSTKKFGSNTWHIGVSVATSVATDDNAHNGSDRFRPGVAGSESSALESGFAEMESVSQSAAALQLEMPFGLGTKNAKLVCQAVMRA